MEHEVVQDGLGIGKFQNSEVYLKGSGKNSGWEYIYIYQLRILCCGLKVFSVILRGNGAMSNDFIFILSKLKRNTKLKLCRCVSFSASDLLLFEYVQCIRSQTLIKKFCRRKYGTKNSRANQLTFLEGSL